MDRFLNQPFTLDRTVRIALFVLCSLALVSAVAAIWEVLLPFLLAGIFAYVMMPFVRFLQQRVGIRSRGLAVLVVFLLTMSLLVLGILYLVPAIQEEVSRTIVAIKQYSDGEGLFSKILPEGLERSIQRQFDYKHIVQGLSLDSIIATGENIFDKAGGLISSTLSVFSWGVVFAMGIIYFIFILMDLEGLAHGLIGMFPSSARPMVHHIMREVDYYMNNYFRGQALIALSVGILLCIGFSIIGLPMAIVLGLFIGLLNFIPYMQALGIIPLGLAGLLMGLQTGENVWVSIGMAYGVLMVVQVIQDSILVPRIMGVSLGMRPSLILLALAVWGYLLGFFGMLIALPATMAIYSIYMRYILQDAAYIRMMDAKMNKDKPKPSEESDQSASAD
ncbi:MAG: AI-2E family transporter [Porphyromonas sp.]|nr:AI-2E family transporter [Porphyromonas sp.]